MLTEQLLNKINTALNAPHRDRHQLNQYASTLARELDEPRILTGNEDQQALQILFLNRAHMTLGTCFQTTGRYWEAIVHYHSAYCVTGDPLAANILNINLSKPAQNATFPEITKAMKEEPNNLFERGLRAQAGLGEPVDYSAAYFYFYVAAQAKHTDAMICLGALLEKGDLPHLKEPNYAQALYWYLEAKAVDRYTDLIKRWQSLNLDNPMLFLDDLIEHTYLSLHVKVILLNEFYAALDLVRIDMHETPEKFEEYYNKFYRFVAKLDRNSELDEAQRLIVSDIKCKLITYKADLENSNLPTATNRGLRRC